MPLEKPLLSGYSVHDVRAKATYNVYFITVVGLSGGTPIHVLLLYMYVF